MGTWTIISPDGDSWEGSTLIKCCGKAVRSRKEKLTDRERIENLADALEDKWLPAETAPKDGSEFIGLLKDGLVFKVSAEQFVNPDRLLMVYQQDDSNVPCASSLVGWIPLPVGIDT